MALAAARALPFFGIGADAASDPMPTATGFHSLSESPVQPQVVGDPSAIERAVAAALEEARQDFELQRTADREEHERMLAAREAELHETVAKATAEQLTGALAALNDAVGAHVSRVLLRFLERSVRERAIGELSETVAALLLGGEAVRVRISGPADLVDRLGAAVGDVSAVEIAVSEAADVTVVIDNTRIETQIGAWMERAAWAVAGGGDG